MTRYVLILLLITSSLSAEPRVRPDNWAQQVIGTELENFYRVDKGVYRSEQPEDENVENLTKLGIKEVLNLRQLHSDEDDLEESDFILQRLKMDAGEVTEDQLIQALRIIKNRKGPILIHCWHGSDRTGVTLAAYRIIFNNWSKAKAVDEFVNGGYGYHSTFYPNLVPLLENLNIEKIKKELNINPKKVKLTRKAIKK